MKRIIKKGLRTLGMDIVRVKPETPPAARYAKNLLFEADPEFNALYRGGLEKTGTPEAGEKRRARFYNLLHLARQTHHLDGAMVECGCWKGLSSFIMLSDLQRRDADFKGKGYFICDSFAGLSEPTNHDVIHDPKVGVEVGGQSGGFSASLEEVRANLSEFPEVDFYPGWLPQSLNDIPDQAYRFVHIDLDLHEPIQGTVEYFYPRLVRGGILLCDDYGSLLWPGAKNAIDQYCRQHAIRLLPLSTGQAVLWKW